MYIVILSYISLKKKAWKFYNDFFTWYSVENSYEYFMPHKKLFVSQIFIN